MRGALSVGMRDHVTSMPRNRLCQVVREVKLACTLAKVAVETKEQPTGYRIGLLYMAHFKVALRTDLVVLEHQKTNVVL